MKLFVALTLLAASCSGAAHPKAPAETSGRAERLQIGSLEAYALRDGHLELPNDGTAFGLGRPPSEIAEVLAAAGLPRDTIGLDIQCLLVEASDRVILFDTGTGAGFSPSTGHLMESLALTGVSPGAITDIFISHAHGDHVGGLVTKSGELAFPAATIHLSAPEWAALQADPEEDSKRLVAAITPKVAPFEPDAQVLPLVKAVATPGHTPGHSSYQISADGETLFYLGDVAHHSIISVQHPDWSIQFDGDHAAAEAVRKETLTRLAVEGTRVFAVHFPFPGIGHFAAGSAGQVWMPEAATRNAAP